MNFTQCLLFLLAGIVCALADPLCQYKPDGNYPLSDTFMYLKCTNEKGQMMNCPTNQVFIARERRCRTVTVGDQTTFCEGLQDGDYRNPWSCSKFFKCVAGTVFTFSCSLPSLVFDPKTDQCVYQSEFACKVVTASSNGVGDAQCSGKQDGKYPMRDTFKYLQCTGGKSQIKSCPANQVFIYREKRCRTVTQADQTTFCEGLPNNDYVWPWNCHLFVKCFAGITYVFNCQRSDLIFDPYKDQCVYRGQYPCIVVKSTVKSTRVLPAISMVKTNRCTGKADGLFVVSDVFQYLECKAGAEIMHTCPDNQIFVAKKMNCSAVTTADEDRFCDSRPTGNYRNPWNCHHFITCVAGHPAPYDRPCHPLTLVYDPMTDRCEHKEICPCKQLSTPTPPKNLCTDKPDGNYILPDVFKYLECKSGQEILHFCPAKQIFAPDVNKCRAVTADDKVTFCNLRPEGNYRNPWNCHHFTTCVTGHPSPYDRPCHPLTLVFDPDHDQCEHDYLMTCVVV